MLLTCEEECRLIHSDSLGFDPQVHAGCVQAALVGLGIVAGSRAAVVSQPDEIETHQGVRIPELCKDRQAQKMCWCEQREKTKPRSETLSPQVMISLIGDARLSDLAPLYVN